MTSLRILVFQALLLFPLAACSHDRGKLMGNPENPYPLKSPPKVGDIVHLPTGTQVTPEQMLSVAADARIVYVGETHDNPASHRLELEVLKGMAERHPGKVALGMEMFVRSQQPVLDRWIAGELDEKAFLKESRWFDNWRMDFAYYRDLLTFARERRIPLVALNAEKKDVASIRGKTADQLTEAQRREFPEMDLADPYQRGMAEAIFAGHSAGKMHVEGFVLAQTLWDETMAESVADYLKSPAGKDRRLVIVAGGNHVRFGFGIPRRVFRRLPASYVTVGGTEIEMRVGEEGRTMDVTMPDFPMVPYDFLAYTAYEALPQGDSVTLGVMMEPAPEGKGLLVKGIVPDSNAARAGVQKGDLLLSIDGESLTESVDLVYEIKKKKPGDKATLQIRREGREIGIEVQFRK